MWTLDGHHGDLTGLLAGSLEGRLSAVASCTRDTSPRSVYIVLSLQVSCLSQFLSLYEPYGKAVVRVPTAQGNWENGPKKSLSGKTQGTWKFYQNTGKIENLVCSSCKFPDSKGKGCCDICCEKVPFFPKKLERAPKSVLCI